VNARSPLPALLVVLSLSSAMAADPLPRRAFLGIRLAAPDASRQGVLIEGFLPGGSAEEAGMRVGDVLRQVDDVPIASGQELSAAMRTRRAGATITLTVLRQGDSLRLEAPLRALPLEERPGQEVLYDAVEAPGGRLRTVTTRPLSMTQGERRPAVLFVQGLHCGSVEFPLPPPQPDPTDLLIGDLAQSGLVTMRVEKSGVGDSTGPPCRDIDLQTELAGVRAGLASLKRLPFVDAERVYLFGHSAGGWMGPLAAAGEPVRGIAVFGTVGKTWLEYTLENERRQMGLSGSSPAEIDDALHGSARLFDEVLMERRPLDQAAASSPELAAAASRVSQDPTHLFGRHVDYFRELAGVNLARIWSSLDTRVLILWGTADFVSSRGDHTWLAEVVNRARPGRALFEEVAQADHAMQTAASQEAAFAAPGSGAYNPEVARRFLAWLRTDTRLGSGTR
jgi:pimeloyl-ACP methyl ester carboxylesterase